MLLHLSFFVYFSRKRFAGWEDKLDPQSALADEAHREVLSNIASNDYELLVEEMREIQLRGVDKNRESGQIEWVLIEDRIFDISQFFHPIGQFIFKKCLYKDITRELYGLKALRINNRAKQLSYYFSHKHGPRTFELLKKASFGEFSLGDLILMDGRQRKVTMAVLDDMNLQAPLPDLQRIRDGIYNDWAVSGRVEFGQFSLLLLKNRQESVNINLSNYWVKNFGKYFLVKNGMKEAQYFYPALSLSRKYLQIKQ